MVRARRAAPVRSARPTPLRIERYLQALRDHDGTDLLLTAGAPPLLRIDGELRPFERHGALTPDDVAKIAGGVLSDRLATEFRGSKELDFSFSWKELGRFRANVFMQRGSMALALRLIPFQIPSMDEIGLPPAAQRFVDIRQGLVLVTGPTGSGKSTTLASMIDKINERRACHILTIEDPIEYVHKHKRSAVNQREIGEDTDSFENALRAALREDPDVLLVGEMRDLETIQIALTMAETGHLVFATLHTNDTAQAVDRIIDVFPAERQQQIRMQLAGSAAGIIYQQLLPRAGMRGRVAAYEVLVPTQPVRNLIKEGQTRHIRNVLVTSVKEGMQTLEMALTSLVAEGVVTYEDAVARSLYPGEIRAQSRGKR